MEVVSQTSLTLDKPTASTAVPQWTEMHPPSPLWVPVDEFASAMEWLSIENPALYNHYFNQLARGHQEQTKKKDDAENLPPVSRVKNKTKSKDAAVNKEPAANNDETPEMSDRLKTSVLDFRKQEGGEALRDREDDQQSRLSQPRARAISSHKDRTSASPKVSKGRKKR